MKRDEKAEVVKDLKNAFEESAGLILVDFRGINALDITELRRRVRESGSEYRVVKNTLAIRAAEETPVAGLKDFFKGPTAIAYTPEDAVSLAKVLKEFAKENAGMSFKAGVVDGKAISVEQVSDLAEMPSREELLSKLLFLLNAPLTRFATALQSPLRNLASLLSQLAKKKE